MPLNKCIARPKHLGEEDGVRDNAFRRSLCVGTLGGQCGSQERSPFSCYVSGLSFCALLCGQDVLKRGRKAEVVDECVDGFDEVSNPPGRCQTAEGALKRTGECPIPTPLRVLGSNATCGGWVGTVRRSADLTHSSNVPELCDDRRSSSVRACAVGQTSTGRGFRIFGRHLRGRRAFHSSVSACSGIVNGFLYYG